MIVARNGHCSVAVKNKLFVIERTCEVFDRKCNAFVALNSPTTFHSKQTMSVGSKIFVLTSIKQSMLCYDADKDEWSEQRYGATQHWFNCSCVTLPAY